jgi:hypothetical protein
VDDKIFYVSVTGIVCKDGKFLIKSVLIRRRYSLAVGLCRVAR